ncbi:MAG: hypothetical protein ACR2G2_19595 [Pseudonocardia sp.]
MPLEPPPEDEEEMLAEASAALQTADGAARRDPEEVAIELLAAQLGARTVDDRG